MEKVQSREGHVLMFSSGWRNYVDMWPNVDFWKYLKNSVVICGFTMIIAMILATMTAYALVRFKFPGVKLFSNSILVTQMIPAILYLIPMYMLFNIIKDTTAGMEFFKALFGPGFNGIMIKGSYLGLIFIYSAWFLPFSIWILRGFFAAIPVELEEAATIDGCSNIGVFLRITLPLAIPGIIATGIFILIQAWDELMFAWMLTSDATQTLPVGIRLFVGNFQNRFDLMMAAATVATIPVLILFFVLQKHIVRGLTAGAVKG
ncbi:MAG: ABC transporter permease [Candidatus Margulisbacteria bacterium GWF2_38_17]|nr:MAG: ABC transporter permease [Candidatus Margulisbacteria bacterium GWD2_39_127]OGI05248.1 MAG: ABC transporter permease [Candidatus Margulisbacteria bacterium GWF2_38_17]OGI06299.1 MAG: ABC transporter permease [Candidatus Margulisbacteria bacterium GWE2_39_32]